MVILTEQSDWSRIKSQETDNIEPSAVNSFHWVQSHVSITEMF